MFTEWDALIDRQGKKKDAIKLFLKALKKIIKAGWKILVQLFPWLRPISIVLMRAFTVPVYGAHTFHRGGRLLRVV